MLSDGAKNLDMVKVLNFEKNMYRKNCMELLEENSLLREENEKLKARISKRKGGGLSAVNQEQSDSEPECEEQKD